MRQNDVSCDLYCNGNYIFLPLCAFRSTTSISICRQYTNGNFSASYISVSADTICDDYTYDKEQADEYYQNKRIRLEGVVAEVRTDLAEPYILLKANKNNGLNVMCYYVEQNDLRGIVQNTNVKLSGTVDGLAADSVILSECQTISFAKSNETYITLSEYEALTDGISYDFACEIIGGLGELDSEYNSGDTVFKTYVFYGESEFSFAIVSFRNDCLSSKTQTGLY